MASLKEYVAQQFPQHEIDVWEPGSPPDLELTDHTVVSYVVGTRVGLDLLKTFQRSVPKAHLAAVEVRPTDATVVPTLGEDSDGVIDLPARRVAAVVAAFLDDDESASSLATSVGPAAGYEVRIVDHLGGWRSPATGTTEAERGTTEERYRDG